MLKFLLRTPKISKMEVDVSLVSINTSLDFVCQGDMTINVNCSPNNQRLGFLSSTKESTWHFPEGKFPEVMAGAIPVISLRSDQALLQRILCRLFDVVSHLKH